MGLDAWFTMIVVAAMIGCCVRELMPPAFAVFGGMVVLLATGVIEPAQALSGFSNPAPITVGALFVLARAVQSTGALEPVLTGILGRGSPRGRAILARVVAPTAAGSAVLNNTPIVAMAAPPLADWARQRGVAPSALLMPLSFAAILGGLLTAIGTSTNIVVDGLLRESGQAGLGMFEIARVGLPVVIAGLGAVVLLAPRLLPARVPATAALDERTREFTLAMRVVPGGPLDGKSVEAGGLRHLQGVFLVRVDRAGTVLSPVAPGDNLHGDDILTFAGQVGLVVDLQRKRGLVSTEERHLDRLDGNGHTFYEAVVGTDSPLVGKTLRQIGFRSRYNAAVLAIHRAGARLDGRLGDVGIRVGDTLLVLADESFAERWRETSHFLLIARHGGPPPSRTRKAPLVAAITVCLMVVVATGLVPMLEASLVTAGVLVAIGALTPREARDAVDVNVLLLIASAFGVGAAIAETGLGEAIAGVLVAFSEPLGALGALLSVLLATIMLTELITNNAAAVLMFPIAMSTAAAAGLQPRGFAMAVAVAASASFLTPLGYQTNTMVYGLGGYRFGDYARLGAPLTLIVLVVSLIVIPVAWPL